MALKKKTEKKKRRFFTTDGEYAYIIKPLYRLSVPIGAVRLDAMNPRKNDKAAKKLAELIKQHGFRDPIIIDSNGIIRAGNTRYKAAKILGMKTIPATTQEFVSDIAATAFGISHNKASEFSDWDEATLSKLMNIEEIGAFSGFSETELSRFNFKADEEEVTRINAVSGGEKDHIIVIVLDAEQKDLVRDLLKKWIIESKFQGIKVQ